MSLCGCGCGSATNVATRNRVERGHVKGEHMTCLPGHPVDRHPPPRSAPALPARDYWLRKRYGITQAEYDEMASTQEYACAICDREVKLVVDHCHTTGRVRGLLCNRCNTQLAFIESHGDRAAEYLDAH